MSQTTPSKSDQPLDVLLVQEDPADRARFTRLLQRQYGQRAIIHVAHDASEGLDMLRKGPVDVALIDSQLPDMFSLEMLEQLKQSGDETPKIVMADKGGERLGAEALKHGAKDYVIKDDLDGESLSHAVDQAIGARRIQQENTRLAKQLEQTESQLNHFLRAISHDMGANLMLLDSSFRQLKKTVATGTPAEGAAEAAEHVEACLRESHRFLRDLSQLSSTGTVDMAPESVDLQKLVDEVLFEQNSLIDERRVEVCVAQPLPTVWCNPGRARQVFTNLIRNALKHGCDEAHPRIVIAACQPPAHQQASGKVWITVADNGPGIPTAHREEIFLPGKRLPNTRGEGSGMGLAIVKKIIDHYRGEIYIDPHARTGTRILFSLPALP